MYFVYILRCRDDTLYCGSAADWEKRMKDHFSGSPRSARYTRAHPPQQPEAVFLCESKGEALRLEYRIKQLRRSDKLRLIHGELPEFGDCPRLSDSALASKDALW